MLKFKCFECDNTTAMIYHDKEGDLIVECLSCEDIQPITESKGIKEG